MCTPSQTHGTPRKRRRSQDIRLWDFNIHHYKKSLPEISRDILTDMKIAQAIPALDLTKVDNYVRALEAHYPSENQFHNALHAADVGQTMYTFLRQDFACLFTPLEKFSLIMAAFAHDVGHNGKNNDFLIKTRDNIALRFNDQSPLENFHAHLAMDLLKQDAPCNFLSDLQPADQTRFLSILQRTILGTDNGLHGSNLQKLKSLMEARDPTMTDENFFCYHKDFLMEILLHAADISNPCKLYEDDGPYKYWCDSIMAEFYALGDLEKKHNLPSTELFQRSKPVHEVQLGFSIYFVRPLYETLGRLGGFDATGMLRTIDTNIAYWEAMKVEAAPLQQNEKSAVTTPKRRPRRYAVLLSTLPENTRKFLEKQWAQRRRRRNAIVWSMMEEETVDFLNSLREG